MLKPLLVFVGRVVHIKTKSDDYFIELLKEYFVVKVIRRESMSSKELVLSLNRIHPDVVFFHALPPSPSKHLRKIKCKNLIWAPMWDGFKKLNLRKRWFFRFFKIKVVTFSRSLNTYIDSIHLQTHRWQRFIKPHLEFASQKDKPPYVVFLWQREEKIGIDAIVQLLGEGNIKKVIYKTDNKDQKIASYPFKVEVLDSWLEKEEYFRKIKEADYCIAPRFAEGIGYSFLEPMAMGKIVIAYDNATMNEYVINGENGYLFSDDMRLISPLKSPKEMYLKVEHYANHYYRQWEFSKDKLKDFILS